MEQQEKTASQKAELVARRRREITAAAAKVFDANGYARTTMDAVAAEAGVAKGSLYNYFPSKHDLFVQVFTSALAEDEDAIEEILRRPAGAAEKLRTHLDHWYSRLEHYRRVGGLTLEFWATAARGDREGEIAALFQQMFRRWHGRISAIIAEGVAAGEFRSGLNIPAAAVSIMASIDGLSLYAILNVGIELDEAGLEAFKQSMLTGLVNPARRSENDTK